MQNSNSVPPLYVSIIEDNRYFRSGWEATIENDPGCKVAGSFGSCEEALENPAIGESDVCLMDIGLPGISGIEGVRLLKEKFPRIAVVMCTVHDDDGSVFDSICAGAIGYLLKKTEPLELIQALKDAVSGGSPMSPNIARRVIASFQKPPSQHQFADDRLTDRELHILQQMALGKSYSTIANELFLSVDGVRYHIRHIYEKLQVHNRNEAIALGLRDRLIHPPR